MLVSGCSGQDGGRKPEARRKTPRKRAQRQWPQAHTEKQSQEAHTQETKREKHHERQIERTEKKQRQ